jgi:hypothetical protein
MELFTKPEPPKTSWWAKKAYQNREEPVPEAPTLGYNRNEAGLPEIKRPENETLHMYVKLKSTYSVLHNEIFT